MMLMMLMMMMMMMMMMAGYQYAGLHELPIHI
jgi:hypothetical protein